MKTKRSLRSFVLAILLIAALLSPSSGVAAEASFFQGKTISIVQGRDPGGTGDLRVRALVPFLQKYIPGNPTIVMEFMPGGGSRKAANHVFRSARPDGLTIGNLSAGMVSLAVLGESGVLYDIDKFHYLGSAYSTYHSVFVSRKDAALMRGEIDARATGPDTILKRNPEWIKKGLADIHAIMETPKGDKHPHAFFGKLPELETFAKTDLDRKVIALQRAFRVAGSPFVLPPGTPKDRVKILQDAFRKTYQDPDFFKEYRKLTADDPSPLLPENHEKAIKEIPRDPEVIELFKVLAGPKKLPPR
jgi:tripartite-type tricarboxylate transporter receptor subunit TctC